MDTQTTEYDYRIEAQPDFACAVEPESNILCFRVEGSDRRQLDVRDRSNRPAIDEFGHQIMRAIADLLGITEGTVKIHLHRIYQKLGVGTRTTATVRASASDAPRSTNT